MSISTLQDIIVKVRRLTGSSNSNQLTDDMIKDYINSFYLYDLPAEFRSLKLKDKYIFDTSYGIDTYAFDSENYTTIEAPVYCAKRNITLFQDPASFFAVNYNWQYQNNITTGNGTVGPYAGLAGNSPVIRSVNNDPGTLATPNYDYPASRVQNILITANTGLVNNPTVNVTDDGFGNLYEMVAGVKVNAGAINYDTGSITGLTFSQVIPQGNPIQVQYNPALPNIPTSILFFQNQFVLRPVPNQGYTIEMTAYRQPTQALSQTAGDLGHPELNEWWELIAAGASKKIYEDRLDSDGVMLMDKMLFERYKVAETRTYAQLGKQSIKTIYSDQLNPTSSFGGWGFGAGP